MCLGLYVGRDVLIITVARRGACLGWIQLLGPFPSPPGSCSRLPSSLLGRASVCPVSHSTDVWPEHVYHHPCRGDFLGQCKHKTTTKMYPGRFSSLQLSSTGPDCVLAAADSPQWRKGPPSKPILCNACGTRFRRTHQLMHLYGSSGGRKALASASSSSPAPSTPRKRSGALELRPSPSPKRLHAISPLARKTSSLSTTSYTQL